MKKNIATLITLAVLTACTEPQVKITVTNPTDLARLNETVEIPCDAIPQLIGQTACIVTDGDGHEIPSQLVYEGRATPQKLLFQASLQPAASTSYYLKKGTPAEYPKKTHGRFAPERYDDYIWENDRIAFRIYGAALIKKDGPSNGLDVIVKRTPDMFLDKIYNDYFEKKWSYHIDNGQGVDCYNVKRSLGAGAMAPYADGQLWLGQNYVDYATVDNGPIRTSFTLAYDTLLIDGRPVLEKRFFSLDAGTHFNKITVVFENYPADWPVAAGIVLKNDGLPADAATADPNHTPVLAPAKGYVAYSEQGDKAKPQYDNGIIYTAVVFPAPLQDATLAERHALAVVPYAPGGVTYYAGAGWSKWGFHTPESWIDYVDAFAQTIRRPLRVEIE